MTGQTPARHGATRAEHFKKDVYLKATVLASAKPSSKVLALLKAQRRDECYMGTNEPRFGGTCPS